MSNYLVRVRSAGLEFIQADGMKTRVLNGVNCDIEAGDRIVLSGPSGSGKSTLLNILGGLIAPTEGDVDWPALGQQSSLQPAKITYVFQAQSLFPALNVLDNVLLPLKLMANVTGSQDAASAMLERLQLEALARKLPEELSGGQAQRVAMARALVVKPRLVLADEPTGQLDSKTARAFLERVLEFANENQVALVVATHDRLLADLMETQWSIEHGRLATPREVEAK